MRNVIVSPLAELDLENIFEHFAENNVEYAENFINFMVQKFQLVADNSLIGKNQDSFILNLRSFPFKNCVIFYFPIKNGIEIYRILHSARNIEKLFDDVFEGIEP